MSPAPQKVALVTGAARGIGLAAAKRFLAEGWRVALLDIEGELLRDAVTAIASPENTLALVCDVSDAAGVTAAIEEVSRRFGRLDALINNAGTTKHVAHGKLDGLSSEDFQRLFGVNTIGPFQMVRAARTLLEASAQASSRAASVVNVSSVSGISGIGSSIAYAATKGALNTMTLSLARALAPLIRVNAVCPGYIDTPWFTKGRGVDVAAKVRDAVIAKTPLKKASSAEDVAHAVCFFASPESGSMTGEILRVDAGAHLVT